MFVELPTNIHERTRQKCTNLDKLRYNPYTTGSLVEWVAE